MFWFVAALVVIAIGVLLLWACGRAESADDRTIIGGAAAVALVLGIGIMAFNSFTVVPTRSVAVTVAFGKPTGSLANGFHLVAPWAEVEVFDASVQTLKLRKDPGEGEQSCATVRLGNQTTACVDVTVQWNIDQNGDVVELYRKYKSFGNIQANLVERQLQRALNVVFETYDPLASVTGQQDKAPVTLDSLAQKALGELRTATGAGIKVDSITIPLVHYDGTTQEKLNAYAQALADTRIAGQREQTAQAVKRANEVLASGTTASNAGVQYQNCLNLIADLAAKNQLANLPATFNCNVAGAGTPVIVGK